MLRAIKKYIHSRNSGIISTRDNPEVPLSFGLIIRHRLHATEHEKYIKQCPKDLRLHSKFHAIINNNDLFNKFRQSPYLLEAWNQGLFDSNSVQCASVKSPKSINMDDACVGVDVFSDSNASSGTFSVEFARYLNDLCLELNHTPNEATMAQLADLNYRYSIFKL